MGHATYLDRPAPDATPETWDNYLHLRDNIAGEVTELWFHDHGCGAWLTVQRDTVTHAVHGVALASNPAPGSSHAD